MPSCTSRPGTKIVYALSVPNCAGQRLEQRAEQDQVEDRLHEPDDHPGGVAERDAQLAAEDDPGLAGELRVRTLGVDIRRLPLEASGRSR